MPKTTYVYDKVSGTVMLKGERDARDGIKDTKPPEYQIGVQPEGLIMPDENPGRSDWINDKNNQ